MARPRPKPKVKISNKRRRKKAGHKWRRQDKETMRQMPRRGRGKVKRNG
jgi:hypothetical protein